MTIGPCWPRVFMDGQGRKVAATVRGGSVFDGDQPVSRACGKVRGLHPRRLLSSAPGLCPCPMWMRRLGQLVWSNRVE